MFEKKYHDRLILQQDQGLFRDPIEIEHRDGKYLWVKGRRILSFGSNDYLGLGASKSLAQKVGQHFEKIGASSSSSRLVAGNYAMIAQAEETFARYFGYPACLFFPSGFQANLGVLSTLFERGDRVFFDKHIHASTVKGLMLSQARISGYNHNNMSHLKKRLQSVSDNQAAVVTESLFSMDGDLLPCQDFLALKKNYNFLSVVDEAHSFGALGDKGKGIARPVADVAVGTFGKALGLFGAFVLLPDLYKQYLLNFCAPQIYTTTLPSAHAAAAMDVLEMIESANDRRKQLTDISQWMTSELKKSGYEVHGDAHIISVLIGDEQNAQDISRQLLEKDIYVLSARYPTVPLGQAILRVSMTSMHTPEDVTLFVDALTQIHTKER